MDKRKSDNVKRLIIVITFICIIILLLIAFILITHNKNDISPNVDNTINDSNNNTSNNDKNEVNDNTNDISNTNTNKNESIENDDTGNLKKITSMETYFWVKDRVSLYYSSNHLFNPVEMMDREVVSELSMTNDNYKNFNDFSSPSFRIDEIYEQILSNNKTLYVVKLKYGTNEQDAKNSIIWIKKDADNDTFSIYPYEYLRIKNYLDFKEGDTISVDSKSPIEENAESKYLKAIGNDSSDEDEDEDADTEKCMKGLFERYKFDLLIDNNHLYEILSEEYKTTKFPELSDFKQYIKDRITDFESDILSEYKVINYNEYVEYRAICNSQRNVVFNVKNMMDYTISLDNYSVVQNKDTYNAFLPAAEAKYCIDRVVQALNYKDYDFVYSKLNPVQKNNYYKNIDDFKEYLSKAVYEQNSYEIDDNYLIISDNNVYQFTVTIRDATGKEFTYSKFTMTVTLKNDSDFVISIVNSDN